MKTLVYSLHSCFLVVHENTGLFLSIYFFRLLLACALSAAEGGLSISENGAGWGEGWSRVQHARTMVLTGFSAPPDRCCFLPSVTTVPGMCPFTWLLRESRYLQCFCWFSQGPFSSTRSVSVRCPFLAAPSQRDLEGMLLSENAGGGGGCLRAEQTNPMAFTVFKPLHRRMPRACLPGPKQLLPCSLRRFS